MPAYRAAVPALALALAALLASPGVRGADAPTSAPAAASTACTVRNPSGGDIRVATCTLAGGRAHRFSARFGGGHDDTSASLAATLDGQPTTCDPGSKMSLFGEDGDVALHCLVTAPGDAAATHTLVVTVLWSHAQYRDVAFAVE